jgi:hypothetical protein
MVSNNYNYYMIIRRNIQMKTGKKMGRPKMDEPKTKPVQVRFTEAEYERLKVCAAKYNLTITQFVREGAEKLADSLS